MSGIEIPSTWEGVMSYAERINAPPVFMKSIKALSQAKPNALYRMCSMDNPPLLPGALQDPAYTQAILKEISRPRSEEEDLESAILRRSIWGAFLGAGGRLEASIHADALTHRPSGMGKAALRTSLEYAFHLASHPNADVRIRKEVGKGGDSVGQFGNWAINYPAGPEATVDRVARATVTNVGVEAALPLDIEEVVPILEKTWGIIQETSYDREKTLSMIGAAITMLPQDPTAV